MITLASSRRLSSLAAAAIAALLALAVAGCSSSSLDAQHVNTQGHKPAALQKPSSADLTNAAGAMGKLKSYRGVMTMKVNAGGDALTMKFDMVVDQAHHLTEMTSTGPEYKQPLKEIANNDDGSVYISNGARWNKAVLDPSIKAAVAQQFDQSKGVISMLSQIAGNMTPNGTATVDGVATNRWGGTLDFARLGAFLSTLGLNTLTGDTLAQVQQNASGTVTAYLDGDQVLRRLGMDLTMKTPDGNVTMTEDYRTTAINQPVSIAIPSADQVDKTIQNAKATDLATLVKDDLTSDFQSS